MASVLHISPFPDVEEPKGGGLIRIAETRAAYIANDHTIYPCHVVTRSRDLKHPLDIKLAWIDKIRRKHIGKPHQIGQIRLRWATQRTSYLTEQIANRLDAKIDIIHLEHPWLIDLVRQLRRHPACSQAKLVYSSHNIESELHAGIWFRDGVSTTLISKLKADILSAELQCIKMADVCWAVSDTDAAWLHEHGANEVTVVPNGCRSLCKRMSTEGIPPLPYVIFVGGDYAPNISGFVEWVGQAIDYIPTGTAVVLAGAAGDRIARIPAFQHAIAIGKLINLGQVAFSFLDQLLTHAHGILLPVSSGGGTNLKSAEALCSHRPIITTSFGMRGFEPWSSCPKVYIVDTAHEFMDQVNFLLTAPFVEDAPRKGVEQLMWRPILDKAIRSTPLLAARC
jgi:glycosyltransferase involved in cell wall biosynthesis